MTRLSLMRIGFTAGLVWIAAASASMAADLNPQQIYERVAPGVVLIIGHPQQDDGGSGGTGSIIRGDGLVLTNAHVVIDEKTGKPYPRLAVYLKPDRVTGNSKTDLSRRVNASVTAFDRRMDLALLKLAAVPASLPALELGDPDRVKIGERVVAIGHPEQGGLWTLTTGVVSAEFDDYGNTKGKHVFQTETGLNRGNSGGPLLDAQGRIIGVNMAIARLAADGVPIMSISFALKSSVARAWLREQGVAVEYASVSSERPPVPVQAPQAPQAPITPAPEKPANPPAPAPSPAVPKAPPPQVHTEVRPYSLDELIRGANSEAERDLDQMMKDMRPKTKPK